MTRNLHLGEHFFKRRKKNILPTLDHCVVETKLTAFRYSYLIVDYDRSNFSVSQALFPDTSIMQNLVSIHPGNGSVSSSPSSDNGRHGLQIGVIVAIVAAVVAVVAVALLGLFIWHWRSRRRPDKVDLGATKLPAQVQEAPDVPVFEAPDSLVRPELAASAEIHELPAER